MVGRGCATQGFVVSCLGALLSACPSEPTADGPRSFLCFDEVACDAGRCQPAPCVFDRDCPHRLVCEDGECALRTCAVDADCPSGLVCRDLGDTYYDYYYYGYSEVRHACWLAPCGSDDDCPPGLVCGAASSGSQECEEPTCAVDEDCSGNLVCEDGQCDFPTCEQDSDCPPVLCI
jgi:hypothetical protein